MRYLVTGGAGFIGSHITDRLVREGNFVRVLDNFSSGKKENLANVKNAKKFELVKGDIHNAKICLKAAKGVDCIIHQAALRSVPKSMSDPYSYNDVNIDGTLNLLIAARELKIKRFVFASSSSVYGDVDTFPEREDFLPKLISPYALTKLTGEYYCRIFSESFGVETVSLRYFNVFGPRQSLDDEYAVVIPKFIHCIMHDEQPPIFGNGKQSRDFTFVEDVVQANILGATRPNIKCGVFNVASNSDKSILELVDVLNKILGKSIKPLFKPIRLGDVFRTLADISQAKAVLGFEPKFDFEQGLRLTVDWFKSKTQ